MANAICTVVANNTVETIVHVLYHGFEQVPIVGHDEILLSYIKHGVDLSNGHCRKTVSQECNTVLMTTSIVHPLRFGAIISVYVQECSMQSSIRWPLQ